MLLVSYIAGGLEFITEITHVSCSGGPWVTVGATLGHIEGHEDKIGHVFRATMKEQVHDLS